MPIEEFAFIGFLPSKPTDRRKSLRELASEQRTLVLYEAPHRLLDTLEDALEILGNRAVVVAREVTKLYEEFMRGRIETVLENLRKKAPRGEITLLIAPPDEEASRAEDGTGDSASAVPLARRVEEIALERGVDTKSALKVAARERGLTRREAYKQLLITRDEA
jgi:16S rRNA (cytidine1402-2'-O)-methyltransferase